MRHASRPISRRDSRGPGRRRATWRLEGEWAQRREGYRPGKQNGIPATMQVFKILDVPLPQEPPQFSKGGCRPEVAPTVGSVLPLVLHGQGGRGKKFKPARPQPVRAGGTAGCSAPPRAGPSLRGQPRAPSPMGASRRRRRCPGRSRAQEGWGLNLCFPSGTVRDPF